MTDDAANATEEGAPRAAERETASNAEAHSREASAESAWAAQDSAARLGLLDAVRAAIGESRHELARAYAASTGRQSDTSAVSDGYLLGAASAASFARSLRDASSRPARFDQRSNGVFSKRSLRERLAQPGLTVRLIGDTERTQREEPAGEGGTIIFSDADACSILLNLALRERFLRGKRPTIVAQPELTQAISKALAPLTTRGLASVESGGLEEACKAVSRGTDSVIAISSPESREALRSSAKPGQEVLGFSSRLRSPIAIVPFLYGREELETLALHVAAELVAPPGPTRGVALVLARDWLQRRVFLNLLRSVLDRRLCPTLEPWETKRLDELGGTAGVTIAGDRATSRGLIVDPSGAASADTEGLRVVTVVDCVADAPREFLRACTDALADLAPPGQAHLVSLFAHPMLLERQELAIALEDWVKHVDVPVVGVGARASLGWTLGGPPVGPRGKAVQNAWSLGPSARVVLQGSMRSRVATRRSELERRARYESAPSLAMALMLGARAFF